MAKAEMTIKAVVELDPVAMRLLTELRDRLTAEPAQISFAQAGGQVSAPGGIRKIAQSQALYAVLCTLDDWIKGVRGNHGAMGHRSENVGDECWRQFAPSDIRRMINDTARELGISAFPQLGVPEENKPLI